MKPETMVKYLRDTAGQNPHADAILFREIADWIEQDCREVGNLSSKLAAAERERDEARAQLTNEESVTHSQGQAIDRLTKQIDALRLGRTAPPAIYTVDIEAAAYELSAANYPGGVDSDRAEEIIRKHARHADAEALAGAIEKGCEDDYHISKHFSEQAARAAIAHLGLALAQEPRDVLGSKESPRG